MARKTDDSMIVEMLKEGKPQKEIAEYFNVSPAAICKRVKRLRPIEEPPSFKDLSQKEKKFVLEIAEGKTQTQAAMNSFDVTTRDSAKAMGHELVGKNDIKRAIQEVLQECGLTKRYRIEKLKTHVDAKDPGISLKALDQTHKLARDYPPENTLLIQNVVNYGDMMREYKEICREEIELLRKKGRDKEADALEIVSGGFIEAEVIEEDTENSKE